MNVEILKLHSLITVLVLSHLEGVLKVSKVQSWLDVRGSQQYKKYGRSRRMFWRSVPGTGVHVNDINRLTESNHNTLILLTKLRQLGLLTKNGHFPKKSVDHFTFHRIVLDLVTKDTSQKRKHVMQLKNHWQDYCFPFLWYNLVYQLSW